MTKDELYEKIIELQNEIIQLHKQLNTSIPSIIDNGCLIGIHDFPSPWFGTVPPSCRKCGFQPINTTWTSTSTDIKVDM